MPRQRGLFRIAQRAGARADRGRAGGDEPRVLWLLSERRLRRRVSERAPPSRLPVHLRVRRHRRRGQRSGIHGSARSASRARRSTASCGCPRSPSRRTITRRMCSPYWVRAMRSTPRSACITSIVRADGATAKRPRHGAARPIRPTPRRRCEGSAEHAAAPPPLCGILTVDSCPRLPFHVQCSP